MSEVRFKFLRSDWALVELEPAPERTAGGIIRPGTSPDPIRKGVIRDIGQGRHYRNRYVPVEAKVGDRVVFFIASVDTKSGKAVSHHLREDERLIRENDILFVVEDGDVEVTI